jgi:hypothetical protein
MVVISENSPIPSRGKIGYAEKNPTPPEVAIAEPPAQAPTAFVRSRPKWDFGKKVGHLLADRRAAKQHPYTASALAREVSRTINTDPGAVMDWIQKGSRPRADRGMAVAAVLGVDYVWLCDDRAGYPPKEPSANLAVALSLLPANEKAVLAEILRDPIGRRAWLASWSALRGRP